MGSFSWARSHSRPPQTTRLPAHWLSLPSSSPVQTSWVATGSPIGCFRCSGDARPPRPTSPPADEGPVMIATNLQHLVQIAFLIGAAFFVLGLHLMNSPVTARSGNRLSSLGMFIAVISELVYAVSYTHLRAHETRHDL